MNYKETLKRSIESKIKEFEELLRFVGIDQQEDNVNKYLVTYYKARLKELEKGNE